MAEAGVATYVHLCTANWPRLGSSSGPIQRPMVRFLSLFFPLSASLTLSQHVRQSLDSSYYSSLTYQKPSFHTMGEDSEVAVEESFSTKPWAANNCQNSGVSLGVTWCAPRPNCDSSAGSATAFSPLLVHLDTTNRLRPKDFYSYFHISGGWPLSLLSTTPRSRNDTVISDPTDTPL